MKVSSRDYSSIYARTPENVTNIRYSPILDHSGRIDKCAVPPSELVGFHTKAALSEAKPSKICLVTKYAAFMREFANKILPKLGEVEQSEAILCSPVCHQFECFPPTCFFYLVWYPGLVG